MAYEVLARKYRPKDFSQVVGQDDTVKALTNALDFDRLHHAYLFSGTRGIGKTTLARIFAACLCCESNEEKVSSKNCRSCEKCKSILDGRYVDVIEVDGASRTKLDQTLSLLENVHYSPIGGNPFKIYLVDEVHQLSKHSFNALLKTLEEPPNHVKFLFATTEPNHNNFPPTVRSRCLHFHLRSLEPTVINSQLRSILEQENVEFDEASIPPLARAAQGSMRDALSLTDQAISYGEGKVTKDSVEKMLGIARTEEIVEILNLLIEGDAHATLDYVHELTKQAVNYSDLLEHLQRTVHELALVQIYVNRPAEPVALDRFVENFSPELNREQLARFVEHFSPEWLQNAYQILTMGMRDLKYAPDERVGFEMTLARVLYFEPVPELSGKQSTPVPAPVRRPASTQTRTPPTEARTTPDKSSPPSTTTEKSQTTSEKFKQDPPPPAKVEQPPKTVQSSLAQKNAEQEEVRKDPLVSSLIDNFDATIVDVKRI